MMSKTTAFFGRSVAISDDYVAVGAYFDDDGGDAGRTSLIIGAGGGVLALGLIALAVVMPWQQFWTGLMPATALLGLGMAMLVAPLSTAIMSGIPSQSSGIASAVNNAVSRVAGLIAVAVFGGFLAARYAASGGLGSFGEMSESLGHGGAMISAFQSLALITAGCAAAGALIAWRAIPVKT